MSEQRPFKVGDDVFCLMFGRGKVVRTCISEFSVVVKFAVDELSFTACGRYTRDANRTLYHANSGIIEIDTTLRPELEVDDKIWVRDSNSLGWERRHFKSWSGEKPVCFDAGRTRFTTDGYEHTWNYYTLTDPNGE